MSSPKFIFSPDLLSIRRKLLNFTQTQIGELVGVDKMTISKWERGLCQPSTKYIAKLSKVLQTKPERMLLMDLEQRAKSLNVR